MLRRPYRKRAAAFLLLACAPALLGSAPLELNWGQRLLNAHNSERANMRVPPLRWDPNLAVSAQKWADYLGRTGKFEHSPDPAGVTPTGENLWAGTKGYYDYEDMVGLWVAEKKDYKPGVFPNNSRSGNLENVGHYTQLIWRDTHAVGCALARGAEEDFLVCRYSHAGNVLGQHPV